MSNPCQRSLVHQAFTAKHRQGLDVGPIEQHGDRGIRSRKWLDPTNRSGYNSVVPDLADPTQLALGRMRAARLRASYAWTASLTRLERGSNVNRIW